MTTARTRFTLAMPVALALALLPAMAAGQTRKVEPVNPVKASKPAPTERGQTPASMGVHGFSVVLVVGGTQGAGATDNVPEAARKALADMKDFLPYKRYQLLDAAWILCCGSDNSQVAGRVRGPDGRDYMYTLDPTGVTGSKLDLRFSMREIQEMPFTPVMPQGGISDTARLDLSKQLYEANRERDDAELAVRTTRQKFEVGVMTAPDMEAATTRLRRAEQRAQELQRLGGSGQQTAAGATAGGGGRGGGGARGVVSARGAGATSVRSIIDSSFSIALGETVVIGTSRLNGDQALIAILTAAAKPGAAR